MDLPDAGAFPNSDPGSEILTMLADHRSRVPARVRLVRQDCSRLQIGSEVSMDSAVAEPDAQGNFADRIHMLSHGTVLPSDDREEGICTPSDSNSLVGDW